MRRGMTLLAALSLFPVLPALAASSEVSLPIQGGALHATLQLPDGVPAPPLALILGGSGPTDRDGNNPLGVTAGSYRKLADALQAAGIATLRPDKRGVGASRSPGQQEADLRFGDYVSDARLWLSWAARQQVGGHRVFGPLILIGHSEGAVIGLAALQDPPVPVAAFISVAGPGEPLAATIRRQLHANPANPAALLAESDRILDALEQGQTVPQMSPVLAGLFRPSVQPYLIGAFQADPAQLISRLTLPVLLVQGDRDVQVGVTDARTLAQAQPSAHLAIIPRMNHVLVDAPVDMQSNVATYARSDLPLSVGLLSTVIAFIKRVAP